MRNALAAAGLLLLTGTVSLAAQLPLDTAYTRQIRELTSEPRFNTELTDHLPDHPTVPSPLDVLGYVPGTIGRLSHVADVTRYFRTLDAASDRVRLIEAGTSDEGRPMIAAVIADPATLERIDDFRDITRRLADPRGLSVSEGTALVERGKTIYYITGSIHSPETGSPEMLMELAYRLAVSETPMIQEIRSTIITVIMPVMEVDGRDRQVDVYNYSRANQGVRPPLVYWGKYVAHDNNRDGMVLSQTLTRHALAQYLYWRPTIMHDLHESVPFLYTSTGTGPYNRAIDAITVNEWNQLAFHEINELTRRGLPGVWTHDFYDGWAPNYVMFIANLRNSVGRFYETYTSFGADCDTARIQPRQTSVEWFRPNPPLDGVRWCIRNNINYQQSGVLVALSYTAQNNRRFLENFLAKSRRAVAKGRGAGTNLWVIPAVQARRIEAANLVNLFLQHGIEVHRADAAFRAGNRDVAAGDWIVRLDQPYGPLADNLLGIQTYRASDPAPYDDTGWTMGALRNVVTHAVADTAALARPMTRLAEPVVVRGQLTENGRAALIVPATSETHVITFRYLLRDVAMFAAESSFTAGGRQFAAGSTIVPLNGRDAQRVRAAVDSLGLTAVMVRDVPQVRQHELDVPRIGLVHSWQNTQNEGWVRYALDRFNVPYTYLSTQELRDSAVLARHDVLILPYVGNNPRAVVDGMPMAGPPIPWRRSTPTPNLGVIDETDDVRPGIGLIGMATLEAWIRRGGLLITEGATAGVPVEYGLAPGVTISDARQLRARGTIVRSRVRDRLSPITYGYDDTLIVYFNQSPLFQTDTSRVRGTELRRDPAVLADQARMRPRVVLQFHPRPDSLLVSGLLEGGSELAGRPAVLDVQLGRGHVVLFAIRPFWRWQTQGSFSLAFNAIMNWNDLGIGWPAPEPPRRVAGR